MNVDQNAYDRIGSLLYAVYEKLMTDISILEEEKEVENTSQVLPRLPLLRSGKYCVHFVTPDSSPCFYAGSGSKN